MSSDKWRTVVASVIAKAWSDPAYKASVLHDPKKALADAGLAIPDSIAVKAVENTAQNKNIVLPVQSSLESDTDAGSKLLSAITPMPASTTATLLQDTDAVRHLVIPLRAPVAADKAPTDEHVMSAMSGGWEAINAYTSANAVAEANAAAVQNVAGATEAAGAAVVVAVGAAVLT